nr:hypothetical protein [uncultured Glaciecola sp.]
MSFKEKSTWGSLLATLLIFGNYAISVSSMDLSIPNPDEMIGVIVTSGQLILPHVFGIEFSSEELTSIPMFAMYLLLFGFILAEIVRFSHQIYLYRKDAV